MAAATGNAVAQLNGVDRCNLANRQELMVKAGISEDQAASCSMMQSLLQVQDEKHQCLKPELLDWFASAGRPLSWRTAHCWRRRAI